MRFSNLQRFFCFHQAAAAEGNTNKPDDNITHEDGSATNTDDDSSTSSKIFINETSNSGNKNSCKSPPCKRYPLLYSTSSSSTASSKAVPVRIQLALNMFMNRPVPQNWSHLVNLLRGENVHDEGRNRTLDRLEKSLADELIVYEAEVDDVEEELGKDRGEMAVEGESVMELLAPDSPHLVNSSVYAESVIYESDEDDGEGDESIIGLGLLPDMYDLDEIGSVDYVPNESGDEQKEEHVHENDDEEEGDYQERGAFTAMNGESLEASFPGQIDWPFPATTTATATAAPSRASTTAQQSTTENPLSFANTKAKAYVILWEHRIRRFDQNQVNVVQKSAHPGNVIRSTEVSKMADYRRKEEAPIANTNAGMKNGNKVAPRKRIIRPTVNPTPTPLPEARDEVNQYYEKQHRSTNINCSPIVRPIASTSTTALWNTNVRDKVMNWENKLKSTHPDEVQM